MKKKIMLPDITVELEEGDSIHGFLMQVLRKIPETTQRILQREELGREPTDEEIADFAKTRRRMAEVKLDYKTWTIQDVEE